MGVGLSSLLVDTHVLQWWSAEPQKISRVATRAMDEADEIVVAAITWWELAWLATHDRITVYQPVRTWLDTMARTVRTVALTPAIAVTANELPRSFPSDPVDRQIYATAIETGLRLVTKDARMRRHEHAHEITIW